MKKTIIKGLCTLMALALFTGCSGNTKNTNAPKKDHSEAPIVGISQYGQHGSLDNCREGFLMGLEESGLIEGQDYVIDYQNAGFDDNITTQIGQSFSSKNVALMCAIATPSATACFAAAEDKNIPVLFTAITDPVEAKLDQGNITGVSDKLPVEQQLKLIRNMQPDAKVIGIVYTTSEPNSVSAIEEYKALAETYDFAIEAVGVTQQSEVVQAVDSLISRGTIDAFSNLTDNNVVGVLSSILEKTNEAGIPVYGSEIEQVKIGCVASAGVDYILLGKQAGAMAAQILKGEKTAEEMPYETVASYELYINTPAMQALSLTCPEDLLENAIEVSQS